MGGGEPADLKIRSRARRWRIPEARGKFDGRNALAGRADAWRNRYGDETCA